VVTDPSVFDGAHVNRRQLLVSAVSFAAAGVLAGCGGGKGKGSGGARTLLGSVSDERAVRAGGALTLGTIGGGASDTVDAHHFVSLPDIDRLFLLYEPLVRRNQAFELENVLAESLEPETKRGDAWIIKLKPGVEFHNGKTVDAEDVIYTLRRILDKKAPGTAAAGLAAVDAKALKKIDATTVRVPLLTPSFTLPDDLAYFYTGIVPTGYDPKNPVGTGPFKYKSFTPGKRSVFTKFGNYWEPGLPKLDEVTIVDFADGIALLNALQGGQIGAVREVPYGNVASLQSDARFRVVVSKTGSSDTIPMRVVEAPFTDVRVRQAFTLMVDREQMVAQALSGHGRLGNDVYGIDDPLSARFPQREQDLEKAKSLLKAAGRDGLTIDLHAAPVISTSMDEAQIFAQQAKGAGVTVNVRRTDLTTFYDRYLFKQPLSLGGFVTIRTFLSQASTSNFPTAPFAAETNWFPPKFTRLVAAATREPDEARRRELVHEAQALMYDEAPYILPVFSDQVNAYSEKLAGFRPSKSGNALALSLRSAGYAA
jgi:peptide/nickel transport system substrate-binding protein